jgi:hypothetical protein
MYDISSRDLATSMRLMAWERAKGELRCVLHTYWPIYRSDGTKIDEFGPVNKEIQQFIQNLDDLLI